MPRCLPCAAIRNAPCKPAGCRAFSESLQDQLDKHHNLQAQHRLDELRAMPREPK